VSYIWGWFVVCVNLYSSYTGFGIILNVSGKVLLILIEFCVSYKWNNGNF
jgi:hypothetical protein